MNYDPSTVGVLDCLRLFSGRLPSAELSRHGLASGLERAYHDCLATIAWPPQFRIPYLEILTLDDNPPINEHYLFWMRLDDHPVRRICPKAFVSK